MKTDIWLAKALDKIAPCVRPRLEAEYRAHIDGMREEGLSESEIVAQLGNAKTVNESLLRQYLSAYEQKVLEGRSWKPWRVWLPLGGSLAITVFLLLLEVPLQTIWAVPAFGLICSLFFGQRTKNMGALQAVIWLERRGRFVGISFLLLLQALSWLELGHIQPSLLMPMLPSLMPMFTKNPLTLEEKAIRSGWLPKAKS